MFYRLTRPTYKLKKKKHIFKYEITKLKELVTCGIRDCAVCYIKKVQDIQYYASKTFCYFTNAIEIKEKQ